MATFHFFTDVDLLGSQAAADAYGPVSTSPASSYQVTSVHRAIGSTDPKAYAVCNGQVLVQDAGSGLVNLILKPDQQPLFAFPRIKFFVYRGIQKSSLVAANNVAAATKNDLTFRLVDARSAVRCNPHVSDAAG